VLKNQLFLVIRFQNDRVFVESFDLSDQFYTADQENGDWCLIAADSVEVNILDILGRRFGFH